MATRAESTTRVRQRERAHLRVTVLRLGGLLGWSARDVIGFSEALTGRPWQRCGRPELEAVRDEYLVLIRVIQGRAAHRSARSVEPAARPVEGCRHAAPD